MSRLVTAFFAVACNTSLVAQGVDHALLVGCTEYENLGARSLLKGCVNDVTLINERLQSVLGIAKDNVQVLAGWPDEQAARPTRQNIMSGLRGLTAKAQRGDRVLLFFAGHGTLQRDRNGDEDDGFDEVFLPADVGRKANRRGVIENSISDDEIYGVIESLLKNGVQVCMLSDSCHSATLARGNGERTRGIDPEEFGVEDKQELVGRGSRQDYANGDRVQSGGFVGLYAVQADEEAIEKQITVDGKKVSHGVFSWSLACALSQSGGDATFDELLRLITASYRELDCTKITPFVHGDRHLPVRRNAAGRSSAMFARFEAGKVHVDGGVLHGLYPESRLAIESLDGKKYFGTVRVLQASALRSLCDPDDTAAFAGVGPNDRLSIKVLETPTGGHALKLHCAGSRESLLKVLRDVDPRGARVTLVDTPANADWLISGNESPWTLAAASDPLRRFTLAEDEAADTLIRLHRVASLLRLPARASRSPWPKGINVKLTQEVGGKQLVLRPGDRVRPGTTIELHALNETDKDLHLWVFWIDADHGVSMVFPDPDIATRSGKIAAKDKQRTKRLKIKTRKAERIVIDTTLGTEHFLMLAVPPETSDLGFLQTESLTRESRGTLKGAAPLLDELAFGPRMGKDYKKSLNADTHVQMLTVNMTWEPVRSPTKLEGRTVTIERNKPLSKTQRPTPWQFGKSAHRSKHGETVVIADRAESPTVLLFDLHENDVLDSALAKQLVDRSFGSELALTFDPKTGHRIAFYDTDSSATPRFDLIRLDRDGDGTTDRQWRHTGGEWQVIDNPSVPWLQVSSINFERLAGAKATVVEDAALAAVRAVCCQDEAIK